MWATGSWFRRATLKKLIKLPDLILGAVDNYTFHEISPFVLSLRQTRFAGHLCLFAGPRIGGATIRKLERLGVEVLRYRDQFPFVAEPHPRNVKALPEPIHVCNSRYFLYYDYLLKRGSEYRNVLITDVRDVVFQADPFAQKIGTAIHVAMENPDIPIGDCQWTAPWIVAAYGEEALERLKSAPMSCSGTTMGPVSAMKRYLKAMLEQIARMKSADAYLDQAAHNRLLHDGKLEPVRRLENFRGPILTVGSEPRYRLNDRGAVVNRDGSVIAVVHQYDRHDELARMFEAKVRPSPVRRLAAKAGFRLRKRIEWLPGAPRRIWARICAA